jgi:PAS domain-containing protein
MANTTCNDKNLSYKYQYIYENFPVGIWEEDWSLIKQRLDKLTNQGVGDLRAHLTANPCLVFELYQLITVLAVNQQAADIYQAQSQTQLLEYIRLSEFDSKPFIDSLVKLHSGGQSIQVEYWGKTLQGKAICLRDCLTIAPDSDEDWGYVITATEDITEHVKKDTIINDHVTYLERASKIAKISYWAANPNENGKVLLMGFLSEKFSLPPSGGTIEISNSYRFMHSDDVDKVKKSRAFSFSNRVGYQLEYRLQSEDGVISYVREIAEVNRDVDGSFIGYHGTIQDVSHQKAHHRQLENIVKKADQLEQQFFNAINAISEGIALYDENHVLIKSNNTYNHYFKQYSNLPITDLCYHDLIDLHLQNISLNGSNSDQIETWKSICTNKNSEPFEFIDGEKWFKIKKETQTDNSYVVTLSNITELKTRELMLEQLSIMDDLTNLFNRRKFNESLDN